MIKHNDKQLSHYERKLLNFHWVPFPWKSYQPKFDHLRYLIGLSSMLPLISGCSGLDAWLKYNQGKTEGCFVISPSGENESHPQEAASSNNLECPLNEEGSDSNTP